MVVLVRRGLQVVLFFLLLASVVAFASPGVGIVERAALLAAAAGLVWAASRVRRLGAPVRHP